MPQMKRVDRLILRAKAQLKNALIYLNQAELEEDSQHRVGILLNAHERALSAGNWANHALREGRYAAGLRRDAEISPPHLDK